MTVLTCSVCVCIVSKWNFLRVSNRKGFCSSYSSLEFLSVLELLVRLIGKVYQCLQFDFELFQCFVHGLVQYSSAAM